MRDGQVMHHSSPAVIIGIGNDYRRDDGVGLHVARLVRDLAPGELKVIEGIADGYALMESWSESSTVFVIDCSVSEAEPGSIYRFDALNEDIPVTLFSGFSTHSINLVRAIALARALERLPGSLTVVGIEGKDCSCGEGLSPEVKRAARLAAEYIAGKLGKRTV